MPIPIVDTSKSREMTSKRGVSQNGSSTKQYGTRPPKELKVKIIGGKSFIADRNLSPLPIAICMGFVLAALQSEIALGNLSISYISDYYNLSQSTAQWVIQSYSILNASLLLLAGKLQDKFGPVTILKFGLKVYILGAALCFMNQNFIMLIFGRMIQAVGISMSSSSPYAVAGQKVKKGALTTILTLFTIVASASASIAPQIGSSLISSFSWATVYIVGPCFACVSYVLCRTFFRDHNKVKENDFDYFGTLLMIASIASVIGGLALLGMDVPTWLSIIFIIVGLVCGVFLVRYELKVPAPIIPIGIISSRFIIFPVACTIASFSSIYIPGYLITFVLRKGFNYDANQLGNFMMVSPIPMLIGGIMGGVINKKVVTRLICTISLIMSFVSVIVMSVGVYFVNIVFLLIGTLSAYFSIGMYQVCSQAFILSCTPARYVGVVSSLTKIALPLGQAIGSALAVLIHGIFYDKMAANVVLEEDLITVYMKSAGITFVFGSFVPLIATLLLWQIGVIPKERGQTGFSESAMKLAAIEKSAKDGVPGMGLGDKQIRGRIGVGKGVSEMKVVISTAPEGSSQLQANRRVGEMVDFAQDVGVRKEEEDFI
ncbi:Major facilitator superfamily like protein [Aduncisulcus paluster]|uniref:Major facilitator superfamily like protein n=1 Tax=Aduncisulcus paluster TaxID=2918883 RepID=A0ABQ5KLZ1_9EUKA|nr:Major facilitator superfamily like protein [Aduncisulcus paluster]